MFGAGGSWECSELGVFRAIGPGRRLEMWEFGPAGVRSGQNLERSVFGAVGIRRGPSSEGPEFEARSGGSSNSVRLGRTGARSHSLGLMRAHACDVHNSINMHYPPPSCPPKAT